MVLDTGGSSRLLTELIPQIGVVVVIATAVVCAFWRRPFLKWWKVLVLVAAMAEGCHLFSKPAVFYLPKVPGRLLRRQLLGVDARHQLYSVVTPYPLGFVWGPRQYFFVGH